MAPLMQLIGRLKGLWQGKVFTVLCMMLPLAMLGPEKHECMAVTEAAISRFMHHPNITQV